MQRNAQLDMRAQGSVYRSQPPFNSRTSTSLNFTVFEWIQVKSKPNQTKLNVTKPYTPDAQMDNEWFMRTNRLHFIMMLGCM